MISGKTPCQCYCPPVHHVAQFNSSIEGRCEGSIVQKSGCDYAVYLNVVFRFSPLPRTHSLGYLPWPLFSLTALVPIPSHQRCGRPNHITNAAGTHVIHCKRQCYSVILIGDKITWKMLVPRSLGTTNWKTKSATHGMTSKL